MGDTLKADDYSIMFDCYVVNVEYILLDAFKDSLKKIEVIWKESGEFTAKHTWIQGIGSLHGMPLGLEQFNMVGGANMLVCMFENDTLKYHNEYFSDCYPLGFPENIERNVINGGTLEVISSKNLIQFVYKQLESNHAALRIFDISGRSMGLYSFNKSGDVTLNKNEHANGVYIYILQDGAKRISGKFIIK